MTFKFNKFILSSYPKLKEKETETIEDIEKKEVNMGLVTDSDAEFE